tara:strand:- start:37 stop:249 length:213 start_codon:yes stop_codon:yes gene_type:complete
MPKKKIQYHGDDEDKNSVYMYHNEKYDIHLFTNADGWSQAMARFDLCNFPQREDWKIYVACGRQPTGSKR